MVKKLQENSVWAKYDIDQDGTVSDEELERATQMLELDLREEKQDSQRRIAWVAMSSLSSSIRAVNISGLGGS